MSDVEIGGVYRHYKNRKKYIVLFIAILKDVGPFEGEKAVVYRDNEDASLKYIRPINMFNGEINIDGKKIPRFKLI